MACNFVRAAGVSGGVIKRILVAILAGMFSTPAHASDVPVNYAGHYEVADKHPGRIFRLNLSQNGSRVHATFFAADRDAGAKPTGEGDGRVDDRGVLQFKFKDSLANEGTATLEPFNDSYRFELRITKFIDPGPLHFYGVLTMKRMPETPLKDVASGAP
jgi:hypothetical protein